LTFATEAGGVFPEAAFDQYRPLFDAALRTFEFEFAN
jgi:hypothetical protein